MNKRVIELALLQRGAVLRNGLHATKLRRYEEDDKVLVGRVGNAIHFWGSDGRHNRAMVSQYDIVDNLTLPFDIEIAVAMKRARTRDGRTARNLRWYHEGSGFRSVVRIYGLLGKVMYEWEPNGKLFVGESSPQDLVAYEMSRD